MIGIYKITSPIGKVYIGQSKKIEQRFKYYKTLNCKSQHKLYNSLKKYGVDKHKFEVIIECEAGELNEFERYYQDVYSVIGRGGLNITLVNTKTEKGIVTARKQPIIPRKGRKVSPETLIKMKNRVFTLETRKKLSEAKIKVIEKGIGRIIKIQNTETGEIHHGYRSVSKILNMKITTLCMQLTGKNPNKTKYIKL